VLHIKGMDIVRNHNFTAEEYSVDRDFLKEGFLEYLPHTEPNGRYPEVKQLQRR